jgi:hypothetical protein
MVGAATCLLVLAGTIEGLLSASAAPAAVKFGVSAATALLLGLYLRAGSLFENGEPSEERGVRSGIRSRRGVLGRAH